MNGRRNIFTIAAFTAIFSNICTAHAQKRLFINFRCKFRHRRSIRRPRFPIRVQKFGDLATFSDDFCILYAECSPFRFVWPTDLESIPHASCCIRGWPHVDNSHQVWSWYDNQQPSYSVFVCWYVTWPCDLDLWPFVLEHMSNMTSHMSILATKYEDLTPIRCSVMSYNVSRWLPLKVRTRPLHMFPLLTWPVSRGNNYIFGMLDPDLPIYYSATFDIYPAISRKQ